MAQLVFRDRRGTDSVKWDALEKRFGRDDLYPAWVADMDIECPECVRDALADHVMQNIHGYYKVPQSFYEAFINWEKNYHGYEVKREWLRSSPGVVPAIYWIVQILTEPSDSVTLLQPVYYPFRDAILETGRELVAVPLINERGRYSIDFELLEARIIKKGVRLLIMSSPHNPVGRVWTESELRQVMDICRRRGVFVISDEIHCDLVMPPNRHIPTATVGDFDSILITLTSASKTFNLAAFQNAIAIIPNQALRAKYDAFTRSIHMRTGNSFGYIAYRAAYNGGREWLEELIKHIKGNYDFLVNELKRTLPGAVVSPLEGTYLAWIDLSTYLDGKNTEQIITDECRLAVDFGDWFGGDEYDNFIRINLAAGREGMEKIVTRLSHIREV